MRSAAYVEVRDRGVGKVGVAQLSRDGDDWFAVFIWLDADRPLGERGSAYFDDPGGWGACAGGLTLRCDVHVGRIPGS